MRSIIPHIIVFSIIVDIVACSILKPKTPEQNYQIAKHHQAEGDYVQADRFLTKAIEKKPDYMDAYIFRAEINTMRDSLVRAVADYTTILQMPNLSGQSKANMLYLRGNAYYQNLQDTLACKDWEEACEQLGHTGACNYKRKNCK